MNRFSDVKRWPGYARARNEAGLSDLDVVQWFGVHPRIIDDWYENGAPVPVHLLFRYMARPQLSSRKKGCQDCPVLEVIRDAAAPPANVVKLNPIG